MNNNLKTLTNDYIRFTLIPHIKDQNNIGALSALAIGYPTEPYSTHNRYLVERLQAMGYTVKPRRGMYLIEWIDMEV